MNKISPKIIDVKVLHDYKLLIKFETNEEKIFDVSPYLQYEVFKPLKNLEEFNKVYIDFGTVCWECGAGLSRDTFYINGEDYNKSLIKTN
jgi:hypothetical protein